MFGFNSFSQIPFGSLPSVTISITGVSSTAQVGSVTVFEGQGVSIDLTGVSTSTFVGSVVVWGKVIPVPGTSWAGVVPSTDNTWSGTTPIPGTSWTDKSVSTDNTWTEEVA